ncbi:MAG: DUF2254 domain-containing protein [Pseudomonadota bacterium]|nr:DUF2254 domain-containing protein [Pseudomonadota bacterium]
MERIRNFILLLRGQLWILPAIISGLALVLASFLLSNGAAILPSPSADIWWLYSGDAASAREVLSSLLSGLMTMTSLVVSITFVILTLAASQLGPRLIATFIADRQIQTVLGVFLGTILYVLAVLRTLDEELGKEAVPHIAVSVGSGLTVVCLFALLWYVHKIARSIIADNVVETVARDLRRNIRDILPEGHHGEEHAEAPRDWSGAASVSLDRSGYILTIGYDELVELGRRKRLVMNIEVRAGHFLLKHGEHVRVQPAGSVDEDVVAAIRKAFVVGQERTPAQDLEYGIRQLVEIALRALSPGINDPFTAIAVLDRLGAALEDVLSRGLRNGVLKDRDGKVRVVADRTDIGGLVGAAFDMIREAGRTHPSVLIRMADVLGQLAPVLDRAEGREAIEAQLRKLAETARQERLAPSDQADVERRIRAACTSVRGTA